MGSRRGGSSKKATAFIKIVRSPAANASSIFRGRGRLQSLLFKLLVTMSVAYAVYLMNHPEASVEDIFDVIFNGGSSPQRMTRDLDHVVNGEPPDPMLPPVKPLDLGVKQQPTTSSSSTTSSTTTTTSSTTTTTVQTAPPCADCPPPSSSFGPLNPSWPQCATRGNSRNVVFLKTHKTGSSTMSNIMLLYADTHNLTVGLPLDGKWELGGYPAYIDRRLIDPPLTSYNILGHHFRFNKERLSEFMPVDTKYITILRSPVDNVESVFGFFQDQEPFQSDPKKDGSEGHRNSHGWMDDDEVTSRLGLFYSNPQKYFNTDTDWFFRSRNHMFFDNGMNVLATDDAYIDQKIEELNGMYTFVLLTDYFDESLILMKHLLCWDWNDVVYVKFKMRIQEAKSNITPELAEQIKSWNYADVKLYDFFNKTFWSKVEDFGMERMASMKYEFGLMQKKAEKECIDSYVPFKKKPWILGAKLKRNPSERCKHLAWSETVYGEHLRDKMYKTIPGLTKPTREQKAALLELFTQVAEGALRVT